MGVIVPDDISSIGNLMKVTHNYKNTVSELNYIENLNYITQEIWSDNFYAIRTSNPITNLNLVSWGPWTINTYNEEAYSNILLQLNSIIDLTKLNITYSQSKLIEHSCSILTFNPDEVGSNLTMIEGKFVNVIKEVDGIQEVDEFVYLDDSMINRLSPQGVLKVIVYAR
jgi:hypothetical protein